jgi:hypothetical protein
VARNRPAGSKGGGSLLPEDATPCVDRSGLNRSMQIAGYEATEGTQRNNGTGERAFLTVARKSRYQKFVSPQGWLVSSFRDAAYMRMDL